MKQKVKVAGVLIILVTGATFGVEKYFDRTIVYECADNVANRPVFIKIKTYGAFHLFSNGGSWVEADYHHPDGETYVYSGKDRDYFDDSVFAQQDRPWFGDKTGKPITVHSTVLLDLLTGGYSLHDEVGSDKHLVASGFCIKKPA